MKKVSKKFKTDKCDLYKLGKRYHIEQPKNTQIRYYLYNEKDGSYTAVLRKKRNLVFCILLICVILMFYFTLVIKERQHYVQIPDTLHLVGSQLDCNFVNSDQNTFDVVISITIDNNFLLKDTKLPVGSSLANVNTEMELPDGSYFCNIKYQILGKYMKYKYNYKTLLVVEEGV